MKFLRSISVQWKIYSIAIVSLIGFAGYLGFNVVVNSNNAALLADVRDESFPILEKAKANRERLLRIDETFNTAVTIGDEDVLENIETITTQFHDAADKILSLEPHLADKIDKIKIGFDTYLEEASTIAELMIGVGEDMPDLQVLSKIAAKKQERFSTTLALQDALIQDALDEFQAGIWQANQNSETLLNSGVILWVFNVLIMAVSAYMIAKMIITNIVSVSSSLEDIAKGQANLEQKIAVDSSDEIGQLAISFNKLMTNLRERNNDLTSMMQNMHQGLFTIIAVEDRFVVHSEYAAYIEDIFELKDIAGLDYTELLYSRALLGSNELDQAKVAMGIILKQDEMNFGFNRILLPREYEIAFPDEGGTEESAKRIKILELEWDPIVDGYIVDKMMVTVRDVTQLRAEAKAAETQREELEIIGQILNIQPVRFNEFCENSFSLLDKNLALINQTKSKDLGVIADLFVNMHTIKGGARTLGLSLITDVVHDAESSYDVLRNEKGSEWNQALLLDELRSVRSGIQRYVDVKTSKLNVDLSQQEGTEQIRMTREMYGQIISECDAIMNSVNHQIDQEQLGKLISSIRCLGTQPLSAVISDIIESLPSVAKQLSKESPTVAVDDGSIQIKNEYRGLFVNVFTHLLRNAIDHGIESPDERLNAGKDRAGNIVIQVEKKDVSAVISLSDDGRGLALSRLKEKAISGGSVSEQDLTTPEEIAQLLFESGLSTATTLTEISGRGVGMDAVRKFVQDQGGDIHIVLTGAPSLEDSYAPFKLELIIPSKMFEVLV